MAKGKAKITWTKRRVMLAVAVVFVILAASAGVIYYLVYVVKPAPQNNASTNNPFANQVQTLLGKPVPDDPVQKALFYAQVAQNYDNLNDYNNALTYYLKAQKVIDDNKLQDQIVYYQPIANDYQAMGNKTNARVYLQLYIKHLQDFLTANPDDDATKAAIKAANDKLAGL